VPWPWVSPLSLYIPRVMTRFFVAVEAKTAVSLPSPQKSVDQHH